MKKVSNWCNAGTSHVWLRNNNTAMPCCALKTNTINETIFKLDENSDFRKTMNSYEWKKAFGYLKFNHLPKGECGQCLAQDKYANHDLESSSRSVRHKINDYANQQMIGERGQTIKDPFFLKIDFSNKCNLKCVMCSSYRSTGWVKDEQKLVEMGVYTPGQVKPYEKLADKWWLNNDEQWWKTVNKIEISGGEPFYEPMVFEFLDFLLSIGRQNININIITNLTLYNKEIDNTLNKFKNLELLCSVDAWQEDIYEYARGGIHPLSVIKENIASLSKVAKRLSIVDTVHCITYDQAPLGKQWIEEQGLKNVHHNLNFVYTPRHLDARSVIPDRFLQLNKLIKIPRGGIPKDTQLQSKFYRWVNALDKVRGLDILKIRPEFEDWFREIESWEK